MSSGSYLREHMTRSAPRRRPPGAISTESLMTDRAAYVDYLEGQLEQMTVACLKTESLELRMQQVTSTVSLHDERILALAKLVKVMQSMTEEHAAQVRRTVVDCQRRVEGVEDRVRASASAAAGASALPAPALPPGAGALDAELEGRIDAKLKAWAEEQMTWARQQALAVELRLQQLAAVQEDRTREWVRELVSGAAREAAAEAVGETQAGLREAAGRIESLQAAVAQMQGAVASLSSDVRALAVQAAVQQPRQAGFSGRSPSQSESQSPLAGSSRGAGPAADVGSGGRRLQGSFEEEGQRESAAAGRAFDESFATEAGNAALRAAAAASAAASAAAAAADAGGAEGARAGPGGASPAKDAAAPEPDRASAVVLGARLDALTGSLASSQAQTARLQGMVEALQRELASERLNRAAALPVITSLMPQAAAAAAARPATAPLKAAEERRAPPAEKARAEQKGLVRRSSLKAPSGAAASPPSRRVSISEAPARTSGSAGASASAPEQQGTPQEDGAAPLAGEVSPQTAAWAAITSSSSVAASERAREAQAVVAAAADRRKRLQNLFTQLAVAGLPPSSA